MEGFFISTGSMGSVDDDVGGAGRGSSRMEFDDETCDLRLFVFFSFGTIGIGNFVRSVPTPSLLLQIKNNSLYSSRLVV